MAGKDYKSYEKGFEFSLMLQALDLLADNKDPTLEQKNNIKLMIQKNTKEFRVPVKPINQTHMRWDQCGQFNQSEISLMCDSMGIHPSSISRYPNTLNSEYVHLFWMFTRDQTLYVQDNYKSGEIPNRIKENVLDGQDFLDSISTTPLHTVHDKLAAIPIVHWVKTASMERVSSKYEKTTMIRKEENEIAWRKTLKAFNRFQYGNRYTPTMVLTAIQEMVSTELPEMRNSIVNMSLDQLTNFLYNLDTPLPPDIKMKNDLHSMTRGMAESFDIFYDRCIIDYMTLESIPLKSTANYGDPHYDEKLFLFSMRVALRCTEPTVSHNIKTLYIESVDNHEQISWDRILGYIYNEEINGKLPTQDLNLYDKPVIKVSTNSVNFKLHKMHGVHKNTRATHLQQHLENELTDLENEGTLNDIINPQPINNQERFRLQRESEARTAEQNRIKQFQIDSRQPRQVTPVNQQMKPVFQNQQYQINKSEPTNLQYIPTEPEMLDPDRSNFNPFTDNFSNVQHSPHTGKIISAENPKPEPFRSRPSGIQHSPQVMNHQNIDRVSEMLTSPSYLNSNISPSNDPTFPRDFQNVATTLHDHNTRSSVNSVNIISNKQPAPILPTTVSRERRQSNDRQAERRSRDRNINNSQDRRDNRTSSRDQRYPSQDVRNRSTDRHRTSSSRNENRSPDRSSTRFSRKDDYNRSLDTTNRDRSFDRRSDSRSTFDRSMSRDRSSSRFSDNNDKRSTNGEIIYPSYRQRSFQGYGSKDRTQTRSRSPQKQQSNYTEKPRDRYYDQQRSYRDSSADIRKVYKDMKKGTNCAYDYNPIKTKFCNKCMTNTHHPFDCAKFTRFNDQDCENCKRGHHYADECILQRGTWNPPERKEGDFRPISKN